MANQESPDSDPPPDASTPNGMPEPLFPNPGGRVDPPEVVGRTRELARLHEAVVRGGAHVTGERRMGKTSLLRKLVAELRDNGVNVVSISAETSSLAVAEDALLSELIRHRPIRDRIARWEKEFEGKLAVNVLGSGITLRGKATRNADENEPIDPFAVLAQAGQTVLVIDEITVLCQHLGEQAEEFLRSLRRLRQGDNPVPVVLAGSIGLHHVVPGTQTINDLWRVEIGPLAEREARELVDRLLAGIEFDAPPEVQAALVTLTSGIPYYVHALTDRLRMVPEAAPVTAATIDDLLGELIASNALHTRHYVDRITDYYGPQAKVVRAALDRFATATHLLTVDQLRDTLLIADVPDVPDRDGLLDLVDRLELDHYLVREGAGNRMSSPLLARIWRTHRRL